jgi:predicted nuclease with TOPRIM domain
MKKINETIVRLRYLATFKNLQSWIISLISDAADQLEELQKDKDLLNKSYKTMSIRVDKKQAEILELTKQLEVVEAERDLMKERFTPTKPIDLKYKRIVNAWLGICPHCQNKLIGRKAHCEKCGQALDWRLEEE